MGPQSKLYNRSLGCQRCCGDCQHEARIRQSSSGGTLRFRNKNAGRLRTFVGKALGSFRSSIVDGQSRVDRVSRHMACFTRTHVQTRQPPNMDRSSRDRSVLHQGAARARSGSREGSAAKTPPNHPKIEKFLANTDYRSILPASKTPLQPQSWACIVRGSPAAAQAPLSVAPKH